jgi:hypothetical protein
MQFDPTKFGDVLATTKAHQDALRAEFMRLLQDAQMRLVEATANLASADTYGKIQAELAAKLQLKLAKRTRLGARRWPDNGGIRIQLEPEAGPDPRYQDETLLQPGCAE